VAYVIVEEVARVFGLTEGREGAAAVGATGIRKVHVPEAFEQGIITPGLPARVPDLESLREFNEVSDEL
jgi:hypothetical protein